MGPLVSGRVVVVAVILAALVAVPAGMIAAWKQNQAADLALVSTATLLVSIPTFWLGLLMLILFGLSCNGCRWSAMCPSARTGRRGCCI